MVADGFVWGRGALDNKASTVAQLEAVRWLREAGGEVARPVHLVVTPDEEVGGATASRVATEHLDLLGPPEAVLDEGSFLIPDILEPVLLGSVAVAEKTYRSYRLVARGQGGHSSMPRGESALDVLVPALDRLAHWDGGSEVPEAMIEGLRRAAPQVPFPNWVVLGNADVLEPVVRKVVQGSAAGNAITRDSCVATMVDAGVKDNVLPEVATAVVNCRLRPTTDPEAFDDVLLGVLGDSRITLEEQEWGAHAGISPWDTPFFESLEAVIPRVAPGAVVIPGHTPGTMDARHFAAQGVPTYRFHPFVVDAAERERLHGTDERLAVAELGRAVRFYRLLLQR